MALSKCQKFAYSVGHVLNDLCASMWFSYLLIFFHKILEFSNGMAGNILLVGQVADGIATPFVGYESDKTPFRCRYGRRKSWHLLGTVCVMVTFPFIFMRCLSCNTDTPEYAQFIYYAPLVIIFQFGWAATQINHLALIPDLTDNDGDKVTLNALRYAFTVISSILVYAIAWLVLQVPHSGSSSSRELSPADASAFRILVLSVVGTGVVFSGIFHVGLREKPSHLHAHLNGEAGRVSSESASSSSDITESTPLLKAPSGTTDSAGSIHWYDWFKRAKFYQMAALYMCTRLIVNLSQVYMPMYLTDTLKLHKTYIAIVPLVTFVSSFVGALLVRPIATFVKQEVMYVVGAASVLSACIWSHFLETESMQIFGMAILLGFGNSVILIMSLSMTARFIGVETATGAFVYGAMSLTDKLSNGVAVVVIQHLNPCFCNCPLCDSYFRTVMSYVVGGITVAALIVLFIMSQSNRCRLRRPETLVTVSDDAMPKNAS